MNSRTSPKRLLILLSGPLVIFAVVMCLLLASLKGGDPEAFSTPDQQARLAAIGETKYLTDKTLSGKRGYPCAGWY
jgi:hypothetical protein